MNKWRKISEVKGWLFEKNRVGNISDKVIRITIKIKVCTTKSDYSKTSDIIYKKKRLNTEQINNQTTVSQKNLKFFFNSASNTETVSIKSVNMVF